MVRYAREGLLALSRFDLSERREYVVVFNASEERQSLSFATSTPSSAWAQESGAAVGAVQSNSNGRVSIGIGGLDAVLLRADSELPRRGTARVTLRTAADLFTNYLRLTATSSCPDPLSVTFAVRRSGAKAWTRLAVDDGAPYRAFLNPLSYRRGEKLALVAIARSSDGAVLELAGCLGPGAPLMAVREGLGSALDPTGRRFAFRPAAILGNGALLVTFSARGESRADLLAERRSRTASR